MSTTESPNTRTVDGREVPAPGTYQIDPSHSAIEAVARHMVVSKVRGRFAVFSGSIVVADDVTASRVNIEIDAASIDTREEQRDAHLRSEDFLDVERFPSLRFTSIAVSPSGDGWDVTGDLTIRDVTQPVTLDFSYLGMFVDPFGNTKAAFSATTELNREDFGMTWNAPIEAGGLLVSKSLKVEIELQAVLS